jgi:hypothetical protein
VTEQSMEALARANKIRLGGLRYRRKVASQPAGKGRLTLARTLERNGFPPEIGALRLRRFLASAAGIGEWKAAEICNDAGMARRDPRIRELTLRERSSLAASLRRRAAVTEATKRGARIR